MGDLCPICHAELLGLVTDPSHSLSCSGRHTFHEYCIQTYADTKGLGLQDIRCPVCRGAHDEAGSDVMCLDDVPDDVPAAPSSPEVMCLDDVPEAKAAAPQPKVKAAAKRKAAAKAVTAAGETPGGDVPEAKAAAPQPKAKAAVKAKAKAKAKAAADVAGAAMADAAEAAPKIVIPAIGKFAKGTKGKRQKKAQVKQAKMEAKTDDEAKEHAPKEEKPVAIGTPFSSQDLQNESTSLFCGDCGALVHYSKARLMSKVAGTWRCTHCCVTLTQLIRGLGKTPDWSKIPNNVKDKFFQESRSLGMKGTMRLQTDLFSKYSQREEFFENGGSYLPLTVWEKQGYCADDIKSKTPKEDQDQHPILGLTYRVRIFTKGDRGIDGQRRSEDLSGSAKRQKITPTPNVDSVPNVDSDVPPPVVVTSDSETSDSSSDSSSSSCRAKRSKKHKRSKSKKLTGKKSKKHKRHEETKEEKKAREKAQAEAKRNEEKLYAANWKLAREAISKLSSVVDGLRPLALESDKLPPHVLKSVKQHMLVLQNLIDEARATEYNPQKTLSFKSTKE